MTKSYFLLIFFLFWGQIIALGQSPAQYHCMKTSDTIQIDGILDENDWKAAKWSTDFIDILGSKGPKPTLKTQVKLIWDKEYLYVAAEIYEPHIWATLTERDDIIYLDNDFEIFLDPDGDGQLYYEIEVNAYNTIMDLMMTKPYYQGGRYLMALDFRELQSAINIEGTINNPNDIDTKWTVEMAIPMNDLCEQFLKRKKPIIGDKWKMNFSRVNWEIDIIDGKYKKQSKSEHNWVWSAQGIIDMHRPEKWGWLLFEGS